MDNLEKKTLSIAKHLFKYHSFRKVWTKNYGSKSNKKVIIANLNKDGDLTISNIADAVSKKGISLWNNQLTTNKS